MYYIVVFCFTTAFNTVRMLGCTCSDGGRSTPRTCAMVLPCGEFFSAVISVNLLCVWHESIVTFCIYVFTKAYACTWLYSQKHMLALGCIHKSICLYLAVFTKAYACTWLYSQKHMLVLGCSQHLDLAYCAHALPWTSQSISPSIPPGAFAVAISILLTTNMPVRRRERNVSRKSEVCKGAYVKQSGPESAWYHSGGSHIGASLSTWQEKTE
jgi:hypothetical protein